MDKVRQLVAENPDIDPNTYTPDNRYNHIMQVQERLNFLRFLLKVNSNLFYYLFKYLFIVLIQLKIL